jgi:copper homeostasis protein
MTYQLEIIGFNLASCRVALDAGAHRIELCSNPSEGGTTPSFGFIEAARKILPIPLYPLIHPRGGDFVYDEEDFSAISADIRMCKNLGCDGVVIGVLKPDGHIDTDRTARLVELAYPMGVTFHRAFDRCVQPETALEQIIETGCERILTSGQRPVATEGAELIQRLIMQAANRIVIMPGSGVRSNNIVELATITGAAEFHSSARKLVNGCMQYLNTAMPEDQRMVMADAEEIKKMALALHALPKQEDAGFV